MIQCLIILVLDGIAQVLEYFCILTEPVGVVEVVETLGGLDTVPGAKVLIRIVRINLTLSYLNNVVSNVTDLLYKIHIVRHDLQVISLMDLAFNLKALLQRVDGVFKELFLILVLLLDVWIDVSIFATAVFNILIQTFLDSKLQLLVIVCVLHDLVHRVLQAVDPISVIADNVPVSCNSFGDKSLAHTQVFNHHTEVSIDRVVLFQSLVHYCDSLL